MTKKLIAFSLVELMISLITISCIAAAFTPVITKKLKKQDIALSIAQSSEIISPCKKDEASGKFISGGDDNSPCQMCTSAYCILCKLSCGDDQYLDSKACKCINCTKFHANCEKCNSSGCTKCSPKGKNGYIVQKGTCVQCTASNGGTFATDDNKCSPECIAKSGYYCDDDGSLQPCAYKYGQTCSSCNKSRCTYCGEVGQRISYDGQRCISCRAPNCYHCSSCEGKPDDCAICDGCASYAYRKSNGDCVSCKERDDKCEYCEDSGKCTVCKTGYYSDNGGYCKVCNLENCFECKPGEATQKCQTCYGGYYVADNGICTKCSSKFGSSCVLCDKNKCLSCAHSYRLNTKTNSCESYLGFSCSDTNFMRVGNLCITRRNMGDSPGTLDIPSTVRVVDAGDTCYVNDEYCCWHGKTNSGCSNKFGGYSGCNRTACTPVSADEICSNFNYLGLKWRVPTYEEESKFPIYSVNLGKNGLQLCDRLNDDIANYCGGIGNTEGCVGSQYGCLTGMVANRSSASVIGSWGNCLYGSRMMNDGYGSLSGSSIRCVADLTGTPYE